MNGSAKRSGKPLMNWQCIIEKSSFFITSVAIHIKKSARCFQFLSALFGDVFSKREISFERSSWIWLPDYNWKLTQHFMVS